MEGGEAALAAACEQREIGTGGGVQYMPLKYVCADGVCI